MCNVTGIEIVFENCQRMSMGSENIGYLICDGFSTLDNKLPSCFFDEDKNPSFFKVKLKYPIEQRLLDRLQRFSDIDHVRLFSNNCSMHVYMPYEDLDKSSLLKYYYSKVRRFFSRSIFVGENLNQKIKYCSDGLEITINGENNT